MCVYVCVQWLYVLWPVNDIKTEEAKSNIVP